MNLEILNVIFNGASSLWLSGAYQISPMPMANDNNYHIHVSSSSVVICIPIVFSPLYLQTYYL